MTPPPSNFDEFWPHYLDAHTNATCRRLHVVGSLTGLACVLAAPWTSLWLLLIGPAFAYALAWIGHFGFERNRPASWHSAKHFWWSFVADWKMIALFLAGRL